MIKIISSIIMIGAALLGIALIIFAVMALRYLAWFGLRTCKHCGHYMEYKGLKENEKESHYLFHCEHCGAWEQVPKKTLINSIDDNPTEHWND